MKAPYQLLRAARVALNIEHVDLAERAVVSKRTLVRIETLQQVSEGSRSRVQAALEKEGIEFLPAEGKLGPGLRISEKSLFTTEVRRRDAGK